MIPYQNCEIFASVIFFFVVKIICAVVVGFRVMHKKQPTLTSIPERSESEDENSPVKWVPKKKHEVLKAKYKCLKKLFQIYDASLIGILPEAHPSEGHENSLNEQMVTKKRRKKRSHRTKCDACAGTTEISSGDVSQSAGEETELSVATAVIRDLKLKSCISTQVESDLCKDELNATRDLNVTDNCGIQQECGYTQTLETVPVPYVVYNQRPKATRLQNFINRIFGIRHERAQKYYVISKEHVYATSDNSISHNYYHNYIRKRRRRGLRLRRVSRPKKIQSEGTLRDSNDTLILTYLQSVRRNFLMDTTPRQCPIIGCHMISYGIINHNDHLNLCHYPEIKHFCHYCHEGFKNEYDKLFHENEHIGITKLGNSMSTPSTSRKLANRKVSNTQTDPVLSKSDVPEEKLKKIVSFFDKINDPDQYLMEIGRNRFSETKVQHPKSKIAKPTGYISDSSDKKSVSCDTFIRKSKSTTKYLSGDIEITSKDIFTKPLVSCSICGERFKCRRQLSLHVDLQHRDIDEFSKFHSCVPIVNNKPSNHMDMISEDGKINVQSIDKSDSGIRETTTPSTFSLGSYTDVSRRKSAESLVCNPSDMTYCYTSMETIKKPSVVNSIVKKMRSGFHSYRWEPGTKIIRV